MENAQADMLSRFRTQTTGKVDQFADDLSATVLNFNTCFATLGTSVVGHIHTGLERSRVC